MQRQSLGSPGSKVHGGAAAKEEKDMVVEDPKRNVGDEEEEKNKAVKPHRSLSRPDKLIHLIPILTFLCFLILYLCSHNPSQSDLAHFDGFKRPSKPIDSAEIAEIADFGRFLELDKGEILAIRSLRNLQEIRKSRPHRKIGNF
ncbi:hypothetical protein L1049_022956 [Liquidambar formosana]|uniref:Uncharacterized protein n=1 Tax=Liquidambar formosana TaxID=63359 RepID=A0AAP0RD90_LIQFO